MSDNTYGSNRHHQGGRHPQGPYGGDNDSGSRRDRDEEGDGYAETGGYGPASYGQRPQRERDDGDGPFGEGPTGTYGRGSLIGKFPRNEPNQEIESGHHRRDDNEYPSGSGRHVIGSGINSVELSSRRGGNQAQDEFVSDAYGGESMTDYGERTETYNSRQNQPSRNTESTGGGYGGQSSERRQQQHHQGRQQAHGENEDRHGRDHVGFGVDTVNFTGEGDSRRSGDLYGGESGTFGGDDETPQSRPSRNTESTTAGGYGRQGGNQGGERRQQHQQQQQHHQGRQQEYGGDNEDRHGRDHVGSGVDTVNLTGEGDSRRTGDLYGGESGTFGGDYGKNTGEYDVSSGSGKYTPGAKVVLHAAEKETEKNPYNDVATSLAGETQNYMKEELKQLGGKFLESLTGGKH